MDVDTQERGIPITASGHARSPRAEWLCRLTRSTSRRNHVCRHQGNRWASGHSISGMGHADSDKVYRYA